ncbi:MAG: hypothetical protein QOD93_7049 [Acetobacteraceae bacterium]|nr:hypothetical protein [Acetobacteraceae bacterium]
MRCFLSLLLLPVLCVPVLSLPILSSAAWAADPPKPDGGRVHSARKTWEQHFAAANLAHNGHLTLTEAKAGYPDVGRHFEDIDANHRGFVTEKDVGAWRVMRKAGRRLAKQHEDKAHPRSAVQRTAPEIRATAVANKSPTPKP